MPQCIYAITKIFTEVEVSSKFLGGKSYVINAVSSKNFAKKLWKMMKKVIFFFCYRILSIQFRCFACYKIAYIENLILR